MTTKPSCYCRLVPFASCDRHHRPFGLFDAWLGSPVPAVQTDEGAQRDPGGSLVAFWQRMVRGESDDEHGGLVDEVGIEVGVTEPGCWGVQCGLSQVEVGVTFMTVLLLRPVTAAAIAR